MKMINTFIIALMSLGVYAQNTADLTITVPNVKHDKGTIMIGLYDEETFLARPLQSAEVKIKDGVASYTFKDVPTGEYAVSFYHDENGNKQMDFEDNGMPKEDYGMSGEQGQYGPPSYQASKFNLTEDTEMSLRM
jgi:uncharacterized protein (DUF2141 family)